MKKEEVFIHGCVFCMGVLPRRSRRFSPPFKISSQQEQRNSAMVNTIVKTVNPYLFCLYVCCMPLIQPLFENICIRLNVTCASHQNMKDAIQQRTDAIHHCCVPCAFLFTTSKNTSKIRGRDLKSQSDLLATVFIINFSDRQC